MNVLKFLTDIILAHNCFHCRTKEYFMSNVRKRTMGIFCYIINIYVEIIYLEKNKLPVLTKFGKLMAIFGFQNISLFQKSNVILAIITLSAKPQTEMLYQSIKI